VLVVVVLACRAPAGLVTLGLFTLCGQSLRRVPPPALAGGGSTVVLCHPPLCAALSSVLSSRASLHFASAPLAYLCVAPPGQSPAYTYLHKTALALAEPLQVFTLSQSLLCLLLFLHRTLSPRHFNEPYAIGYQSAVAVPTLATWEVGAP
jgi:hypothetical protein